VDYVSIVVAPAEPRHVLFARVKGKRVNPVQDSFMMMTGLSSEKTNKASSMRNTGYWLCNSCRHRQPPYELGDLVANMVQKVFE
jgi:hypothetical protein